MFKDELGGKIMTELSALRAKGYAYITEDDSAHKRAKGTKKCIIKREIMFEHYKDCLFNSKTIIKSQQRFRSDHHNVHTEEVNKIPLSSNDDKRIQTSDRITTYPYGINESQILKNESQILRNESQETFNKESQQTNES